MRGDKYGRGNAGLDSKKRLVRRMYGWDKEKADHSEERREFGG